MTRLHPIFKKGDKKLINNYRGIAILNAMEKIFEKIVHKYLLNFLQPIISKTQHGFLPRRSVISNLLEHHSYIINNFEDKNVHQTDVCYFDASKAFDVVIHSRLLQRLKMIGIDGMLLQWFQSYLYDRSVQVTFNGSISSSYTPSSGVPQGSILGPLLFVVYINDLQNETNISSKISFYADDIKLSRGIKNSNDVYQLQNDVNNVTSWCYANGLTLNATKCETLSFSSSRTPMMNDYVVNGTILSRNEFFKDLGIIFDPKCKFIYHIDKVVTDAYKLLGFIMRTSKWFRNLAAIIHLYKTLVRSKLEYATQIWRPHYALYKDKIESIQRRFTRFVFHKFRIPYHYYESRLQILNLESLETRREKADFYLLYKIINGELQTSIISDICIRLRRNIRNMSIFGIRRTTSNVAFYSPLYRMCRNYNDIFKDQYLFNLPYSEYRKRINDNL